MRELRFRAGGRTWAIDAREVLAVRPASVVAAVPDPPDGVLGLAAFRGEAVTVVAIPGVVDGAPPDGSILRLAPPREHLAVWVPGPVALAAEPDPEAVRLDPDRLR